MPAKPDDLAKYITVGLTRWIGDMGKMEIAAWKAQLRDYPDAVLKDAWNAFQREYRYPSRPNVAELVQRCEARMKTLRSARQHAWDVARQLAAREREGPTDEDRAKVDAAMAQWRGMQGAA